MPDPADTTQSRPAQSSEGRSTVLSLALRAVIPLGLLGAGWFGYSKLSVEDEKAMSPPPEPPSIRTRTVELRLQDYPVIIRAHGVVRPHNETSLSSLVSGQIIRIHPEFEDGAYFSEGDVLVEVDAADYRTAVALAEAGIRVAKANVELAVLSHERNREMIGKDLIPEAEVDLSSANLAQAKASLSSAETQMERAERDLQRTQVKAPFDGRVRQRSVGLGQSVGPGTALGVVFTVDQAEIRLPIAGRLLPFVDLPETVAEAPIAVEFRDSINESETVWRGQIVRTEGVLNQDSLELFAIARVPDPFGRSSGAPPLRIGQPVVGSIRGVVLSDVVALPRAAVHKLQRIHLIDEQALTLTTRIIDVLWSDEEHVVVRDPSLADGFLLATTHLVYAPEGAEVELIPDIPPDAASATSKNAVTPKAADKALGGPKKS